MAISEVRHPGGLLKVATSVTSLAVLMESTLPVVAAVPGQLDVRS